MLVLSLPAGALVDRVSKRRLLVWTQAMFLVLALCLGILCVLGVVRYWHVAAIAVVFGVVNAFDVPARQAFVVEMVGGTDDMSTAVALNSALFSGGRLIGPALGGLAIAAWASARRFWRTPRASWLSSRRSSRCGAFRRSRSHRGPGS